MHPLSLCGFTLLMTSLEHGLVLAGFNQTPGRLAAIVAALKAADFEYFEDLPGARGLLCIISMSHGTDQLSHVFPWAGLASPRYLQPYHLRISKVSKRSQITGA